VRGSRSIGLTSREGRSWPGQGSFARFACAATNPVLTDGPFVEAKELLGGFIVLEATDLDEATAIVGEWPALRQGPGARVEVVEAGNTFA
jgi:hypothetical protein